MRLVQRPSKLGTRYAVILGLLAGLFASSCRRSLITAKITAKHQSTIRGQAVFLQKSPLGLASSCTAEQVEIQLFSASAEIESAAPLATSKLDASGHFALAAPAEALDGRDSGIYQLIAKGCPAFFARIVTGYDKQDITAGSSLLVFAVAHGSSGDGAAALTDNTLSPEERRSLANLINALNQAETMPEAYDLLTSNQSLQQGFGDVFGMDPAVLKAAPPVILAIESSGQGDERAPAAFGASAAHWDPAYAVAYLWKRDNTAVSTSANFTYIPSANDQGLHTVSLFVGRMQPSDDATTGQLDLKVPLQRRAVPFKVLDSIPARPPVLTLAGKDHTDQPTPVGGRDLNLTVIVGEDLTQCESFSSLALTENMEAAPLEAAAYNITCQGSGTQALTYSLKSAGDGPKTLRLWARDATGNLSRAPSILALTLRTAPPAAFTVTSPAPSTAATAPTVQWTAAEGAVSYHLDVSTAATCAAPLQTYDLAQVASQGLSTLAEGTYYVCLTAVDDLGHRRTATNSPYAFTVDTTPPGAFTITSPGGGSVITDAQPTVTWSAASGAAAYALKVATAPGCATPEQTYTGLTGSSYRLAQLASRSYYICLEATDAAGNLTAATNTSANITVDLPLSPFSITGPASLLNSAAPVVAWNATADAASYHLTVSSTADCATTVQDYPSLTTTSRTLTTLTDGTYYACVSAVNVAAHGTAATNNGLAFTVDTTPPAAFAITAPATSAALRTPGIGWAAAAGAVTYDAAIGTDAACSGVVQSFPGLPSATTSSTAATLSDGVYYVCVTAKDHIGNVRTATNSGYRFTVDNVAPAVTALSINGGATNTNNNHIKVTLSANDGTSYIKAFCLKTTPTPPSAGDGCWTAVDAPIPGLTLAKTLSLANFDFSLGYAAGPYLIYGWVRDEAGNRSDLTAAGAGTDGVDQATIVFNQEVPPLLENVIAANTDAPAAAFPVTESTFSAGQSVYIKWRLTATNALGATPVSLYYTTNDTTFTPITTGLANGANGSCTVNNSGTTADDNDTGCYLWTSGAPGTSYFKILVKASDSHNLMSSRSSQGLNTGSLRVIAGNTDLGLGGNAQAAVFFNSSSVFNDMGSLVVAQDGTIYFRDVLRGILKVSPTDNVQRLYIPTTGVTSGDGGPVANATLLGPQKIALDFNNGLLIYDSNRIRRVDLTTQTIDTLIGGGSLTGDNLDPRDILINSSGGYQYNNTVWTPLAVTPNGDIYFWDWAQGGTPATGMRTRVYKAATQKVTSIYFTGVGDFVDPTYNFSACGIVGFGVIYDPAAQAPSGYLIDNSCHWGNSRLDANGVATAPHPVSQFSTFHLSRAGELYVAHYGNILKFNPATNTTTRIFGIAGGGYGVCADGTPALSCAAHPEDVFVAAQDKVYFADHGLIRTIDENGNVLTLAGQPLSYGDGKPAVEARFNVINSIGQTSTGSVIILDRIEALFREFTRGGTIQTIAGNKYEGGAALLADAKQQPLALQDGMGWADFFAVDPATGDVFYNRAASRIARLDRVSGQWFDIAGGGSTPYFTADGLPGSDVFFNSAYMPRVIGFNGTQVLGAYSAYDGSIGFIDGVVNQYALSDGTQTHLAGTTGATLGSGMCADGTAGSACTVVPSANWANATYDPYTSSWLLHPDGDAKVYKLAAGGTVATFASVPRAFRAYAYHRNAGATVNMLYYCSGQRLYSYDLNTSTETALPWPVASVQCQGASLLYDSGRNSLVFPFSQNNLYGIAEYMLP